MNRHSDQDFESLNALADGELGDVEADAMRQRLLNEPDLNTTYDEIRQVKRKLSDMALVGSEQSDVQRGARKPVISRPWAIAASIAGIGLVAAFLMSQFSASPATPVGVAAWHKHLSANEYVVRENEEPLFVSLGQSGGIPVPDLSSSKLYLVDTNIIETEPNSKRAVMHYRGLRGCRLTLWYGSSGTGALATPPAGSNGTFRSWKTDQGNYAVIATGMDKQRFASIAEHIELLTKLSDDNGSVTRTAMADAYAKATRCA